MYREKMSKICKKKTIFYALIKIIMYITAIFLCTKFPTAVYLLAAMVLEEIVSIVTNKHVKNESNRIYSNISNENEYSIDYAVESWRERNTGVDSLND